MAKPTKAQKRKRTVQRVIAIVAVVLVALLAGTLYVRRKVQRSVTAQSGSNIRSATVTTGSIKATVSGSGTLVNVDTETSAPPSRSTGISIPAWWAADSWRARRRWPWSSRRR